MDLRRYQSMPPVGAAMTPFPHFVHPNDPVADVERLMEEHRVRHIPVQDDGRVVGIVSERELHQLVNRRLPQRDKERIRVRDVQIADPYVAEITTPLAAVAAEMAERHIGSAIVVKHGKLVGILSVTDVCRLLADFLEQRFTSTDPTDAA